MRKPIMEKYKEELNKVDKAIKEIQGTGKSLLEDKLWKIYGYINEIINTRNITKEDEEIKRMGYHRLHFDEWWENERKKDYPNI